MKDGQTPGINLPVEMMKPQLPEIDVDMGMRDPAKTSNEQPAPTNGTGRSMPSKSEVEENLVGHPVPIVGQTARLFVSPTVVLAALS